MPLTRGGVAKRAGVTPKAVRLYEEKGLLKPAGRTEAGYRTYSERDVELLRFIRRARALDLSLEEVKQIIDLQRQGAQPCDRVLELLDSHLTGIDRAIADLEALRAVLSRARRTADERRRRGDGAVVCQIIEAEA